jgi:type I restriction enzyme S subunit
MPTTRDEALRIVRELREGLAAFYGERLKGVYLFGSYARGEAQEDSDIDMAIVLAGPLDAAEEGRQTCGLIGGLSLRENCLIAAFFLSEEEHRKAPYEIHRSIVREGVPP